MKSLRFFSIFSSGGILFIRADFAGSYLGNIPERFGSHWPKGSGGERL